MTELPVRAKDVTSAYAATSRSIIACLLPSVSSPLALAFSATSSWGTVLKPCWVVQGRVHVSQHACCTLHTLGILARADLEGLLALVAATCWLEALLERLCILVRPSQMCQQGLTPCMGLGREVLCVM